MKKVLAVASGGGHWVQLLRLRHTFDQHDVEWLTTGMGFSDSVFGKTHVVTDANLWNKLALIRMFIQVFFIILKVRPDVVISTGAAPGFAAILLGRMFGAKTIWIESIANVDELSKSGEKVGRWAHIWLTQWEHLAKPEGPHYWGSVL
ncbi:MAG: hypothetical protein MI976_30540 [Pseudomonadales bacterium]|nr:hypothetical protein [Pseudomonadales bacterium]